MSTDPNTREQRRQIQFNDKGGPLAAALGVDPVRMDWIDDAVNAAIDSGASIRKVVELLNEMDLSDSEWTSAIYTLGYFDGRTSR